MLISQMFKFPLNDLLIGRLGCSVCVYMLMWVLVYVEVIIRHRIARNLLCLCQALGLSMTRKIDITSELRGLAEGHKH